MMDFNVTGVDQLVEDLTAIAKLNFARKTVALYTTQLGNEARRRAVFRGHFRGKTFVAPTGFLQRSIFEDSRDGGFTGVVSHGAHYGGYVEKGTRYMDAQPYLLPALNVVGPRFLAAISRLEKI